MLKSCVLPRNMEIFRHLYMPEDKFLAPAESPELNDRGIKVCILLWLTMTRHHMVLAERWTIHVLRSGHSSAMVDLRRTRPGTVSQVQMEPPNCACVATKNLQSMINKLAKCLPAQSADVLHPFYRRQMVAFWIQAPCEHNLNLCCGKMFVKDWSPRFVDYIIHYY